MLDVTCYVGLKFKDGAFFGFPYKLVVPDGTVIAEGDVELESFKDVMKHLNNKAARLVVSTEVNLILKIMPEDMIK